MRSQTFGILSPDPDYIVRVTESLGSGPVRVVSGTDASALEEIAFADVPCGVLIIEQGLALVDCVLDLLGEVRKRRPDTAVVVRAKSPATAWVVEAMQRGASDVIDSQVDCEALPERLRALIPDHQALQSGLVAVDRSSRELLALAQRLAASSATVMIAGESGSGKEVYAQFMHQHSPRKDGPFVAINCAAIPENMLEAILFGYEKGAFTGATEARPGKFEQADGGTLLLDEISEMPLALQAKILRVLQEREAERLGGKKVVALDVRVIATTNRDLKAEVAGGRFREDLYYRLNVLPLHLPGLRARRDDIQPLAESFLQRHAEQPCRLSQRAIDKLLGHDWPGNVRELENVIQRALVLRSGAFIRADDIRFEDMSGPARQTFAQPESGTTQPAALGDAIQDQEARLILDALKIANGKRKQAAERLGISPRTLRYKLARIREAGHSVP